MLGKRIINSNDATGGACTTNTNDYPTTNLAYYKMSSAADEKGTYNGTATNVNFNVAGKFGNAGDFNGSSGYISVPNSAGNNISTFSISFWFKTNGQAATGTLFNNGGADSTQTGWYISILSSGVLRFVTSQGGVNQPNNDGTTNYANNSWHNVVLVYTAVGVGTSTYNMYIDGNSTPEITGSDGRFTATSTQPLTIGRFARLAIGYFDGTIDQVRIFNSALNATQVTSLYNEVYCVPTIVPSENFNTVLYDGNGSTQSITGVGFQPDLVWVKNRLTSAENHLLSDVASGFGKILFSNLTNAQVGSDNTYFSQLSNGFSINTNNGNISGTNNYVAWSWKAGGAAVSNTDGIITSQVSANVDAGFSIVKYTGNLGNATIGHGLDEAPELVIYKSMDNSRNWLVQAEAKTNTSNYLHLNLLDAYANYPNYFHTTTDETIGIQVADPTTNANEDYIAYAFHSVDGFSKMGSYTGTGATGNTIVTGFRPAFVMIKRTNGTSDWNMWDNRRGNQSILWANGNNQEATNSAYEIIFSSNAFTVNATANFANGSGDSYIFMAFAEEGFVPDNFFNDDSTVATYKLNGDLGDDSGKSVPLKSASSTYGSGVFNQALYLTGTQTASQTSTSYGSMNITGSYTISLWFKATTVSKRNIVWYIDNLGYNGQIELSSDNRLYFGGATITSQTYSANTWYNVVMSFDASNGLIKAYVNGLLLGSRTGNTTTGSTQCFGHEAVGLTGYIDQVRIFDRILNAGEVTALYNE